MIRANIPQYGALTSFPFEKDDIVAIIPKDHPLSASDEPLEIPDFIGFPLAIPFDILNIVYTVFGQHAVAPNISIITSINETAIEWARSFQAIALIPYAEGDEQKTSGMIVRPIADEGMYVTSVFLIRKDRVLSNAGQLFFQEIGIEM